jgi:hypothetical protein
MCSALGSRDVKVLEYHAASIFRVKIMFGGKSSPVTRCLTGVPLC